LKAGIQRFGGLKKKTKPRVKIVGWDGSGDSHRSRISCKAFSDTLALTFLLWMLAQARKHYRAVFTSDWHLGFRGANTVQLLAFLKSITCDYLYVVGDGLDLWEMVKRVRWDATCTAILRRILKMAAEGTKLFWTPGNHDEAVRLIMPLSIGDDITITDYVIHVTASGRKFLVVHGDQFDFIVGHMEWLAKIGSTLYGWLITVNGILQLIRVKLGFKTYWSLSAFVKAKTKRATSFIGDFEQAAIKYAEAKDCDGIICGHIHKAALYSVGSLQYANCGDWVESLTALVENDAGDLELIRWYDHLAGQVTHNPL